MSDQPRVEVVPLTAVTPDPANVRKRTERNRAAILHSLKRFGAGRSIVLDGKNVVRAGNGTIEQAQAAGIKDIVVVDARPDQLVAVRRPDWNGTEATAYAIADNRAAELAAWSEDELASLLESLESEGIDLGDVGFTHDELSELLSSCGGGSPEPPPADKPNPRNLPIDAIFTISGSDASCCVACNAGLKYGLQSARYRLCPYADRNAEGNHRVMFVDNEYKEYNHAIHTEVVRSLRPKYATTRDIISEDQCKKDGIEFYDLLQVLEMAAELEQYAENVIVIPKYECLDKIPEKYILGYSIPTSHGGTQIPWEAFKGRKIHLLGGSWKKQLHYLAAFGDNVVSFDNNYILNISRFGRFVVKDGSEKQVGKEIDYSLTNGRMVALALSFGSIGAAINELCAGFADPVGEQLESLSESGDVPDA